MKLVDSFTVEAPIDVVYETLLDLPKVTGCMPGAELIANEDGVCTVGIRVSVGPISMQYRGEVEIVERDPAAHRAVLNIRARETRGQGTADARAEMRLSPAGDGTHAELDVDVDVSGLAASLGQGAIQDVSSKLVGRFARNLTRMLSPAAAGEADGAAAAGQSDSSLPTGELVRAVVIGRLRSPAVVGGTAAVLLAVGLGARRLARRRR